MTVGVAIPARNEEATIERCVRSVLACGGDALTEVVVVDNLSTDRTAELAAQANAQVVSSDSRAIGELRNIGADHIGADVVAYIDADCEAPKGWITTALDLFQDPTIGAVNGHLDVPDDANWIVRNWAIPVKNSGDLSTGAVGASLFVRRDVFDRVGGFDSRLTTGEDSDINRRIVAHGLRVYRDLRCNVIHHGYPDKLTGIIDRQIWQVHGQFGRPGFWDRSIVAAMTFGLMILLGSILAVFDHWPLAIVCLASATAPPCLFAAIRLRRTALTPTPLRFAQQFILAASYLTGRAIGLTLAVFGVQYTRRYK